MCSVVITEHEKKWLILVNKISMYITTFEEIKFPESFKFANEIE